MNPVSQIQYLSHHQIDKVKWDECIEKSVNGLIYAYADYLDAMADNWDAIVIGDYQAVMPLTWRRKYFVSYLYQPFFVQQLGLFYTTNISSELYALVEKIIMKHFRFAEININYLQGASFFAAYVSQRENFVLDINKSYPSITAGYENGFLKNLRRATTFQHQYSESVEVENVVALYSDLYSNRFPQVKPADYGRFEKLCKTLQLKSKVFIRQVKGANGELLAVVLLLKDGRRLYNIMSCNTAEGRRTEANYYLYDRVVHEFCESGIVLDMEGSDIKGIADFYRSLGCVSQPYSFVKYNYLPWPIKLLK